MRQVAYLKASNPDMGDHFACGGSLPGHIGNAVAISADGNTVVVGAPHESSAARGINGNAADNSLYTSGAAYVFVRRGDAWVQQAYVKASNAGQSDLFGMNVALSADGNTMAVSAPWERSAATGINGDQNDDSLPQAGAVYVFTRSGDSWSQQAYVKASNTGRRDARRRPVRLLGRLERRRQHDGRRRDHRRQRRHRHQRQPGRRLGPVRRRRLRVLARTGNTWTQQAYVKGSNTEAGDLFGYDVSLSDDGNTLVAAGYDEDGPGRGVNVDQGNGMNGSGAIYVFSRTGTDWRQDAYLKGSRSEGNDALGFSVAISGDGSTIVAGAGDESCLVGGINPQGCDMDKPEDASGGSAGAAYVWVRSGDTWTEQAFIKASNPDLQDSFAANLAVSRDGNTLLVGAADGGQPRAGHQRRAAGQLGHGERRCLPLHALRHDVEPAGLHQSRKCRRVRRIRGLRRCERRRSKADHRRAHGRRRGGRHQRQPERQLHAGGRRGVRVGDVLAKVRGFDGATVRRCEVRRAGPC